MVRRVARGCLALTLLVAAPARAADAPTPDDTPAFAEHEAVFRAGLEQYGRGNYVAAIATWESLVTTMGEERGYKVLYNLGLAYQQVGDATRAIDRHRAFVKQVGSKPAVSPELKARAEDAAKRAAEIEATHGAVTIGAPKKGGIVLTRVGSGEPRPAGYTVWLRPGDHVVELHSGTEHAKRVKIEVVAGGTNEVDTTPDWEEAKPLPPPPPRPEDKVPTIVWIGAAATVVSFALPISLYVVANGKRDDASKLGAGHTDYPDARSSYEGWRTGYYVSYALPLGLAVTTAALYLLRPTPATTVGVGPTGAMLKTSF